MNEVLKVAPAAWQEWVKNGYSAIERCRRNVAGYSVVKRGEQDLLTAREKRILDEIHACYAEKKHPFEGLASYVPRPELLDTGASVVGLLSVMFRAS